MSDPRFWATPNPNDNDPSQLNVGPGLPFPRNPFSKPQIWKVELKDEEKKMEEPYLEEQLKKVEESEQEDPNRIKYRILLYDDWVDFETEVENLLNDGWQFVGTFNYIYGEYGETFIREMVKYPTKPSNIKEQQSIE